MSRRIRFGLSTTASLTKVTSGTTEPYLKRGKILLTLMIALNARETMTLWMCVRLGTGWPREGKSDRSKCSAVLHSLTKVSRMVCRYLMVLCYSIYTSATCV